MSNGHHVKTAAATAERLRAAETRRRAREVLVQSGMTTFEIATVMGTSPGAVKQALARDMRRANAGDMRKSDPCAQDVGEGGVVWA